MTATDVQNSQLLAANVTSLMSAPVLTAYQDESLWEAWQLMYVAGLRHLAILQSDGRCVGVLSDRMVVAAGGWDEEGLRMRQISELAGRMSPVKLDAQCSVADAATALTDRRVEAALVIERERLVGIVTETDLVRWLARSDRPGA